MSDLQELIEDYRDVQNQLREALVEAFPVGSPVYIPAMKGYAKVAGHDGEFVQLLFENGNVWPRPVCLLQRATWDAVSPYWRRSLEAGEVSRD